jgi:2-alkyl-3-oxoalkanoate reductase
MKYLVIGGGGFLGKALCLALSQAGHEVISLSRGRYAALEQQGIKCIPADISKELASLAEAFEGVDTVFHTAAKVEMWGRYAEFYRVNVSGTRHVIEACRKFKVPKLVYTSSPSVVADGANLQGVDESYPYPKKYKAYYPQTKAMAEQEVLAANSTELYTLSLRPHLIWGPGDTNFVPTILARARAGKLIRVGAGQNKVDLTFIEDGVQAHLLAAQALDNNPNARGKAFFISQGEPVNLWDWINEVLKRNGLPEVMKRLPVPLAMSMAAGCELFAGLMPGGRLPLLTRFLVSEMSTDHYFDISRARRELRYCPKYTQAEAMLLTFAP